MGLFPLIETLQRDLLNLYHTVSASNIRNVCQKRPIHGSLIIDIGLFWQILYHTVSASNIRNVCQKRPIYRSLFIDIGLFWQILYHTVSASNIRHVCQKRPIHGSLFVDIGLFDRFFIQEIYWISVILSVPQIYNTCVKRDLYIYIKTPTYISEKGP